MKFKLVSLVIISATFVLLTFANSPAHAWIDDSVCWEHIKGRWHLYIFGLDEKDCLDLTLSLESAFKSKGNLLKGKDIDLKFILKDISNEDDMITTSKGYLYPSYRTHWNYFKSISLSIAGKTFGPSGPKDFGLDLDGASLEFIISALRNNKQLTVTTEEFIAWKTNYKIKNGKRVVTDGNGETQTKQYSYVIDSSGLEVRIKALIKYLNSRHNRE